MSDEIKCSIENYRKSCDLGARVVGEFIENMGLKPDCVCHRCIKDNDLCCLDMKMFRLDSAIMVLCPICGNKRCPKASDHRLECTGSNEPGQEGSVYQ